MTTCISHAADLWHWAVLGTSTSLPTVQRLDEYYAVDRRAPTDNTTERPSYLKPGLSDTFQTSLDFETESESKTTFKAA